MTYRQKEYLKDRVLRLSIEANGVLVSSAISSLGIADERLFDYVLDQMTEDGSVMVGNNGPSRVIITTTKGYFFLKIDGGHQRRYAQYIAKQIWEKAKIAAIILNALIIITLSFLTYRAQDRTTALEKEVERLKQIK